MEINKEIDVAFGSFYPWKTEYQTQYQWRKPLVSPLYHEIQSHATQATPQVKTESIQTLPLHLSFNAKTTVGDTIVPPPTGMIYQVEKDKPNESLHHDVDSTSDISLSGSKATYGSDDSSVSPIKPEPKELEASSTSFNLDFNKQEPAMDIESKYKRERTKDVGPGIVTYGSGNTHPVIPQHNMKTFNVRAPIQEVYPNTRERGYRTKDFVSKTLDTPATTNPPKLLDPKETFKQYLEAKKQVDLLQSRFKTEYAREFVNWSTPKSPSKKNKELVQSTLPTQPSPQFLKKKVNFFRNTEPAGIPSNFGHESLPKSIDPRIGEIETLGAPWNISTHENSDAKKNSHQGRRHFVEPSNSWYKNLHQEQESNDTQPITQKENLQGNMKKSKSLESQPNFDKDISRTLSQAQKLLEKAKKRQKSSNF